MGGGGGGKSRKFISFFGGGVPIVSSIQLQFRRGGGG